MKQGPAGILLVFFFIYLSYLFLSKWFHICAKKQWCGCDLDRFFKVADDLNENIGDYFQVLDNDDRKYTLSEEINCRLYGMCTMLEDDFNKLTRRNEGGTVTRALTGIHTYDLLRNPSYVEQFQYFSAYLPDRDHFIVDEDEDPDNNSAQSDLVRIVLNMAYFRQKELEAIDFTSGDGIESLTGVDGKAARERAQKKIDDLRNE